jgi:transcriptional regulator with XRE-family HTH domain
MPHLPLNDRKMKDRIRQIMESQHMTQQVFADHIGVGAATLSSIFNGRTRPTLNIVDALKKKFPNISTDWLMFGSGDMYLPDSGSDSISQETENQPSEGLFSGFSSQNPMLNFEATPAPTPQNAPQTSSQANSVRNTRSGIEHTEVKFIDKPQRKIVEIRVFYDDQTFDTFEPKKK